MTTQAISNITSQTFVSPTSSPWASLRHDFKGLENSLLNGDLSGAQSAFGALQQAVTGTQGSTNPNSIPSQLGQSNSPLGQDLQAVSSALGANDLSGAQKAFAKLQQDIESARQANSASQAHHGGHAHHAKGNDGDADDRGASSTQNSSAATLNNLLQSMSSSQSTNSSANDLQNALQSLAKSDPKVAGDLVTLINDMNNTGAIVNTKA